MESPIMLTSSLDDHDEISPAWCRVQGQDFGNAYSFAQAPQNWAARLKKRTDLVALRRRQKCSRRILSS
ncbi:hypothetical protein BMJ32_12155 [Sinorhizobium medicae]|nr:hypothetical protein BMJ32_12155 [Sinorhizobium medicae]PLU57144.1 hypothetical protein BMJ23_11165 [Sinorhizobium medicae]